VSPLWRDEVGIFVGPSKIVLARMRRGIRPKCIAEQGIPVAESADGDWSPALDTLGEQLDNEMWQDANLRVVVSDHWARFAVVPWSPELSKDAERITHAKMILTSTYGEMIDQWTTCLSDSPPNSPAIVSAIPTELLDQLEQIVATRKLRIVSLQPHLIVSYNSWREYLPDATAWFASIDDGSLSAMHLTNGRCDKIRSVRISDDWTVEIRRIQTMGRLAQNRTAEGRVYVDAPVWLRAVADKSNTALEWLDDDRVPQNIADKVSLLKGMYA
jgi:hypothetical protein